MNIQPIKLTKRSQDFLDNLRLYLFSSGKKEDEIDDIVLELEDHLFEAEKRGKSIDDIVGQTPKAYMEQLSQEMSFDYKGWLKYIPVIMLGAFAYILLGDAIRGNVKYSMLQVIGYPVVCLILLGVYMKTFQHMATNKLSKQKNVVVLFLLGSLPISLFLAVMFLNGMYDTPMLITLGATGNIAAGIVAILIFLAISIWSKTWFSIILPVLLFTPEVLIRMTSLNQETKIIVVSIIPLVRIAIYYYVSYRKQKMLDK